MRRADHFKDIAEILTSLNSSLKTAQKADTDYEQTIRQLNLEIEMLKALQSKFIARDENNDFSKLKNKLKDHSSDFIHHFNVLPIFNAILEYFPKNSLDVSQLECIINYLILMKNKFNIFSVLPKPEKEVDQIPKLINDILTKLPSQKNFLSFISGVVTYFPQIIPSFMASFKMPEKDISECCTTILLPIRSFIRDNPLAYVNVLLNHDFSVLAIESNKNMQEQVQNLLYSVIGLLNHDYHPPLTLELFKAILKSMQQPNVMRDCIRQLQIALEKLCNELRKRKKFFPVEVSILAFENQQFTKIVHIIAKLAPNLILEEVKGEKVEDSKREAVAESQYKKMIKLIYAANPAQMQDIVEIFMFIEDINPSVFPYSDENVLLILGNTVNKKEMLARICAYMKAHCDLFNHPAIVTLRGGFCSESRRCINVINRLLDYGSQQALIHANLADHFKSWIAAHPKDIVILNDLKDELNKRNIDIIGIICHVFNYDKTSFPAAMQKSNNKNDSDNDNEEEKNPLSSTPPLDSVMHDIALQVSSAMHVSSAKSFLSTSSKMLTHLSPPKLSPTKCVDYYTEFAERFAEDVSTKRPRSPKSAAQVAAEERDSKRSFTPDEHEKNSSVLSAASDSVTGSSFGLMPKKVPSPYDQNEKLPDSVVDSVPPASESGVAKSSGLKNLRLPRL